MDSMAGGPSGTTNDESAASARLVRETLLHPQEEPGGGDPIGPQDWLKTVPFEADAASERLGWVGLQAARYREAPASELEHPGITHHRLVLFLRPPDVLNLLYDGVKRYVPPHAGAISV